MIYRFAGCEIDGGGHVFRRDGTEVHVEPQVFELLLLLAERAGQVVSRDEIMDRVWGGRIVSEATVAARISAARAAVGDDGRRQAVIRTVTRVGLQLVVPTEVEGEAGAEILVAERAATRAPIEVRYTTSADGCGIAWTSEGSGPPLMRAAHWLTHLELDRTSAIWGPWLDRLSRGRRLVRFDYRGTGMSDSAQVDYRINACVEDMKAVADAAGLDRFSIFCASQSAPVSFVFAARYPERVHRIVSYGGWAQGSAVRDAHDGPAMNEAINTMLRLGWGQPEGGYMRSIAALFMPAARPEQVAEFVKLQIASTTPERAVEIRDVIATYDVTEILARVRAPVLVAHARNDNLHPFAQAQLLARHLPNARLKLIESNNHILMPDEPAFDSLMQAVDAFLEEG